MSEGVAWPDIWTVQKVAGKLAGLRVEKTGLSRRAFAAAYQFTTYQTINKIENAEQYPSLEILAQWLQACGTTFSDFFEEDLPARPYPYPKHLRQWLDRLSYVLSRLGPMVSITAGTLELEYGRLVEQARDSPDPTETVG